MERMGITRTHHLAPLHVFPVFCFFFLSFAPFSSFCFSSLNALCLRHVCQTLILKQSAFAYGEAVQVMGRRTGDGPIGCGGGRKRQELSLYLRFSLCSSHPLCPIFTLFSQFVFLLLYFFFLIHFLFSLSLSLSHLLSLS